MFRKALIAVGVSLFAATLYFAIVHRDARSYFEDYVVSPIPASVSKIVAIKRGWREWTVVIGFRCNAEDAASIIAQRDFDQVGAAFEDGVYEWALPLIGSIEESVQRRDLLGIHETKRKHRYCYLVEDRYDRFWYIEFVL